MWGWIASSSQLFPTVCPRGRQYSTLHHAQFLGLCASLDTPQLCTDNWNNQILRAWAPRQQQLITWWPWDCVPQVKALPSGTQGDPLLGGSLDHWSQRGIFLQPLCLGVDEMFHEHIYPKTLCQGLPWPSPWTAGVCGVFLSAASWLGFLQAPNWKILYSWGKTTAFPLPGK